METREVPINKLKERIKQAAASQGRPQQLSFNRAYFVNKLEDLKLGHREAAQRLGFGEDHTKVTRTLSGKRRMSSAEAGRWAALFRVPVAEVLEQTGVRLDSLVMGRDMIPIQGWVDGQGTVHTEKPTAGPRAAAAPPDLGDGVALRCRAPGAALDRWLAFYRPGASIAHDALNRLCVIQTAEGTWLLRVLAYGYDAGSWNLVPFCGMGAVLENVRVQSASPVLYFKTT